MPANALRKQEWEVRPVNLTTAYQLVASFHYAGTGSNTAVYSHGLFRRSNFLDCLGVAWWIPPTKAAAIANFADIDGFRFQECINLSRLVLVNGLPTNAASFLLGQTEKMIRADGRFPYLLTYADEWRGHTGAIYRAANWEYRGKTKPEAVWVDARGRMVARKAGPHTRTKAEMEALGYRMLGRFPKHRFRKILNKPARSLDAVSSSDQLAPQGYAIPKEELL